MTELPSVVRAVSSGAPVVPQQRTGSGVRPAAARRVYGRDMTQPYKLYDPLLPVVVDVDGTPCHGQALGAAGDQVHVGWSDPDGSRLLRWLPIGAVTFS